MRLPRLPDRRLWRAYELMCLQDAFLLWLAWRTWGRGWPIVLTAGFLYCVNLFQRKLFKLRIGEE